MTPQVLDEHVPAAGTSGPHPARPGVRPGALLVLAVVVVVVGVVLGATRLVHPAEGPTGAAAAAGGHAHGAGTGAHAHGDGATDATGGTGAAPSEATAAGCQPGTPTAAETTYVGHMVAHHRQAVELGRVLRSVPGVGYRVQNLADHIAAVQRGEAQDMQAWLDAWAGAEQPVGCDRVGTDHGQHGAAGAGTGAMATMPGMVAPADVAALGRMPGPAAERRYLELMITHHQGAVTMSEPVAREGANPWVLSLARHVVADQVSEIGAMRRALAGS